MNEMAKNELAVGIDLDVDCATVSIFQKESTTWNNHQFKVSMVYTVTDLGELLYGEAAVNYARIHERSIKSIPYEYGMEKIVEANGFVYTTEELYTDFFRYLKSLINNITSEQVAAIVLSTSDEGVYVQHILRKSLANIGISAWSIIAKPAAVILSLIVNRGLEERDCNVLSLVVNDRKIECCNVECGDGVIEVVTIENVNLPNLDENMGPALERAIEQLVKNSQLGIIFENINVIQICTNNIELSNETKQYLRKNVKKDFVYNNTSEQSSIGALMQSCRLIGHQWC